MEIFLVILGVVALFLLLSAAGWIIKLLGVGFSFLAQGVAYLLKQGIGCFIWSMFILGLLLAIFGG